MSLYLLISGFPFLAGSIVLNLLPIACGINLLSVLFVYDFSRLKLDKMSLYLLISGFPFLAGAIVLNYLVMV